VPFTFAHPAAAIPLLRSLGRYGVLSALVIGSLTPDFSYFLPLGIRRSQSHSLGGLFWFCMPAGLVAYVVFQRVLARPVAELLPAPLRMRLLPILDARPHAPWRAVLVSLFIGATTHVAWDAFTHAGAPIVRVSRSLRFHLVTISDYPISVYTVLAHLSTALGLVLVFVWLRRWFQSTETTGDAARVELSPRWRSAAIVAVVAGAAVLWMASGELRPMREHTLRGLQMFLRHAVPAGISSITAALLLYAIVWQLTMRRLGGSMRALPR
jgi:membrane-bound metal-dependent hydrolase YbcI (DUF457 family)